MMIQRWLQVKGKRLVQGEDIFFKATEEDKTKIKKALRDETLKQLELKRQQAFYEYPKSINQPKKCKRAFIQQGHGR